MTNFRPGASGKWTISENLAFGPNVGYKFFGLVRIILGDKIVDFFQVSAASGLNLKRIDYFTKRELRFSKRLKTS